jgi:hypothetical protein
MTDYAGLILDTLQRYESALINIVDRSRRELKRREFGKSVDWLLTGEEKK